MQRELGRFQKALASLDKAIVLDPRHANARFNKGVALLHELNDRAAALAAWEELVRPASQARPDGQLLNEVLARAKSTQEAEQEKGRGRPLGRPLFWELRAVLRPRGPGPGAWP